MVISDIYLFGDSDVGIVPGEAMVDTIISSLNEGAQIVGDLTAGKQALPAAGRNCCSRQTQGLRLQAVQLAYS